MGIYTSEKLASKTFLPYSHEIVSISVSVPKLLVLPVWGTASTSGLYLMLFSEVDVSRLILIEVDRACPKTVS